MQFFVSSLTSFKEGVQHNSLLGQSLCEHQEIEAESGRRVHFHQFLTRARYYYSQPCCASHSVIIAQPQPPAPRYRLETCNILGQAVEPDINTFKERRRWAEKGNNRIPNNIKDARFCSISKHRWNCESTCAACRCWQLSPCRFRTNNAVARIRQNPICRLFHQAVATLSQPLPGHQ